MFHHIKKKILLFVEPSLTFCALIHKAKVKGYKIFIISQKDTYLTFSQENAADTFGFFQTDTHNEQAVLNLVRQLAQKFKIEGVIPAYKTYGPLSANIAASLNLPGLNPEAAHKICTGDHLFNDPYGVTKKEEYTQEYSIDGFIRNYTVYILSFTEKLTFNSSNDNETGYILQEKIDPLLAQNIRNCVQKFVTLQNLNHGAFYARVKTSKTEAILLQFTMGFAQHFITTLMQYAEGTDYYDKILDFFSHQGFLLERTLSLNAGILFLHNSDKNKKHLNAYFKKKIKNKIIIEVRVYDKFDKLLFQDQEEKEKIGHVIFMHQDYQVLKNEMHAYMHMPI